VSRHQRLQHSLRSPARRARRRHCRLARMARRHPVFLEFTELPGHEFYRQILFDEMVGMQVRQPASLVLGPLTG